MDETPRDPNDGPSHDQRPSNDGEQQKRRGGGGGGGGDSSWSDWLHCGDPTCWPTDCHFDCDLPDCDLPGCDLGCDL